MERNPAVEVEKLRQRRRLDLDVSTPEEVRALCRAAVSRQDAAICLTAAFTRLRRGELIALRWRDVDFPAARIRVSTSYAGGQLTAPKSSKVRSVPLASEVAAALASSGSASAGPATTTSSSPASSAAGSTAPRCGAVPRGARARRAAP